MHLTFFPIVITIVELGINKTLQTGAVRKPPLPESEDVYLFEGCASLLSESGFKDFQDRNRNVKRDYFRKGQGAFSPSCFESRFIGAGRHVYSIPIAPYPKAPVLNPDLSGRGDMCHLSESQIASSGAKSSKSP